MCKTGPWGQGPVFLQQLALLDGFDLTTWAPGSAEFIHTVTECAKLAFADREAWYGDPRQTDVPLAGLLSAAYAAQRRALVGEQAPAELRARRPGRRARPAARLRAGRLRPGRRGPRPRPRRRRGRAASASRPRPGARVSAPELGPGDTCHLDVADRFGNLVSATPSGGWLQSSPVVPGLGFCLGTRGQMFCADPRASPARWRPAAARAPPCLPSLALRDGEPYLAFGTPGGDEQDQWTLAVFLNHAVFGMNLQEAIDFPAFHNDHFPSSFYPRESLPRSLAVESRTASRSSRTCAGAVTRWTCGRPGRWAGSAPWPRRRLPVRRRQPPRHAGLRRRPLADPECGLGAWTASGSPALQPGLAIGEIGLAWVLREHGFQHGDDAAHVIPGASVAAGHEDHAEMAWATRRDRFVVQRPEVAHVVRDDGPVRSARASSMTSGSGSAARSG